MATLGADAVSFYPTGLSSSDFVFGPSRGLVVHKLLLVLTGQGGQTNTITAHSLGMEKIIFASSLWDATNSKGYPTTIDPVNDLLILLSGADPQAPVDVTTTAAYVTVVGFPKITV